MPNLTPQPSSNADTRRQLLQRYFWRLHFFAGLFAAPLILFAALSGLLYVFTPQIEAWRHGQLDHVPIILPAMPLDQQVIAAQNAMPGQSIKSIIPAFAAGDTTQVIFNASASDDHAGHAGHLGHTEHQPASAVIVYVDPGTAQVRGSLNEADRFRNWSRKLHSMFLQNDSWRWPIELSASSLLFLLISGVYLWWPRESVAAIFSWSRQHTRRAKWRYLHSTFGLLLSGLTLVIVLTGLTWSKFAGDNFRVLQNSLAQSAARIPKNLHSTFSGNTSDQTITPQSAQSILEKVRAIAPPIQIQMTPPRNAQDIWRIENADRSQPAKRFQMALDAYNGALLFQSDWQQLPLLAKATAVGIPFHRGEFGWWNQMLLVVVGLAVIFYIISGYAMWLQRRRLLGATKKTSVGLSAPTVQIRHAKAVPWWLWLVFIASGLALPVLGAAMLLVFVFEALHFLMQAWQSRKAYCI